MCSFPLLSKAQVGNPAPNFTVVDTHGDTITLYQLLDSGKVVVLDFFYTTCIPCQYYSPQVNAAYEKYGCNTAKTFFMSIDYGDTNAEVLAYDEQYDIVYPSVSGLQGGGNGVVNQYNIQGFPTLYVIDSTKTIVAQIDPPTLQVFNFRFQQLGIPPAACLSAAYAPNTIGRLDLFPNPVAHEQQLQFRLPEFEQGTARYEIQNFIGQTMQDGTLGISHERDASLKLRPIASGSYLLKINFLETATTYFGVFVVE